ncbi:MAG TPA: hypothetical protein VK463_11240 [Desulfomonilaceae bacterium]|nr:hypothetical protein [Desulfomonilaceae bacterium]
MTVAIQAGHIDRRGGSGEKGELRQRGKSSDKLACSAVFPDPIPFWILSYEIKMLMREEVAICNCYYIAAH